MIILQNVSKSFGSREVISGISFEIGPGEFVCITGPSGAGKSTLASLLIGAEAATSGTIEVDGVDITKVPPTAMQLYRRRVGFVFQDYKLLQNRTVEENVAFPLEVCGASDALIRKRTEETLVQMNLLECRTSLPRELSGGEKARAAIARAIVHQPMIIIADEPTGNLDPTQSLAVLELLKKIHGRGTTIVLATHDATLVNALRTRVIRLQEGRIIRDSIGGYDEPAPRASTEQRAEPVLQEEHAGGRKVRITSIGG